MITHEHEDRGSEGDFPSRTEVPLPVDTQPGAQAPLEDLSKRELGVSRKVLGKQNNELTSKALKALDESNTPLIKAAIILEIRKILGETGNYEPSDFDTIFGNEAKTLKTQLASYKKSELRFFQEKLKDSSLAAWELPIGKVMITSGVMAATAELVRIAALSIDSPAYKALGVVFFGGLIACIMLNAYYYSDAKKTPFINTLIEKGQKNMRSESIREGLGIFEKEPDILQENPNLRDLLAKALEHSREDGIIRDSNRSITGALNTLKELDSNIDPEDPELQEAARYLLRNRG